jgi:hypothetical protein
MRTLNTFELAAVAGGARPRLARIVTNPGGFVSKTIVKNPNLQIFTFGPTLLPRIAPM